MNPRDPGLFVAVTRSIPLALLAVSALLAGGKLLLDVLYPFGLDYGEGIVLDGVRTVLEGRTLYPPLGDDFYAVSIYMPLYVWLCAAVAWFTVPTFLAGRILALACTAACGVLIYTLARREDASRRWSLTGALLFLTSTPVVGWGALMRVDTMGLAFSLGGLLALRSGVSPLWAGLLFSLAILSKQSMLAGLFGACLFLAARRRWRDLGLLLVAALSSVAVVCMWQAAATHGWFWFHVVTANSVRYSSAWLLRWLREVPVQHAVLAGLALVGWRVQGAPSSVRRPSLLSCYLIGACGVVLLVGKLGGVVNYFLDYVAVLSILAAVGVSRLLTSSGSSLFLREMLVAAALLLHLGLVTRMPDIGGHLAAAPGTRRAVRALAESPGPVLSDDPSLVAGAGQRLVLEPFQYTQMGRSRIWRTDALVARLRQGAFPVIVLRFDPWDPSHRLRDGTWADGRLSDAMVAAIRDAYRVDERWDGLFVLRPLP